MTGGSPQPVVLDTTVVSNFASTDSISFLAAVLESPVVVPAVRDIRDRLDHGEAESLLGAIEHRGTLATDDLAARKAADQRDVPVTRSIGLLALGVESAHLTPTPPTSGSIRGESDAGTTRPSKA